jgi:hypothetical protein
VIGVALIIIARPGTAGDPAEGSLDSGLLGRWKTRLSAGTEAPADG